MTTKVKKLEKCIDNHTAIVYNDNVLKAQEGVYMSNAEYEVIKETFPKWAARVEEIASGPHDMYRMGMLWGLADGLSYTGQCGNAEGFVMETIRRAKAEQEKGGEK